MSFLDLNINGKYGFAMISVGIFFIFSYHLEVNDDQFNLNHYPDFTRVHVLDATNQLYKKMITFSETLNQ